MDGESSPRGMISRDLHCVFVHVPKAAGQSIERVFLDYHGLTWETRAPLLLRRRNDPSEGPPRLAHLSAREYVEYGHLTERDWADFFKFSFVRNPWMRAVSMYKYYGDHRRIPFPMFVRDRLAGTYWRDEHWFVRPQADFVCDEHDRVIVDFIGRVENIDEDFAEVARRVGLSTSIVPHHNTTDASPWSLKHCKGILRMPGYLLGGLRQRRYQNSSYASYYDTESVALVRALYERDVELFGYRFEDLTEHAGTGGVR